MDDSERMATLSLATICCIFTPIINDCYILALNTAPLIVPILQGMLLLLIGIYIGTIATMFMIMIVSERVYEWLYLRLNRYQFIRDTATLGIPRDILDLTPAQTRYRKHLHSEFAFANTYTYEHGNTRQRRIRPSNHQHVLSLTMKIYINLVSIKDLPADLTNTLNLEFLEIVCDTIRHTYRMQNIEHLHRLQSLRTLKLPNNRITGTELLEQINALSQLRVLNLQNNELSSINALTGLTKLKMLALNSNYLDKIELKFFPSLKNLYISDNFLLDFPELPVPNTLKNIHARNNLIYTIPDFSAHKPNHQVKIFLEGNNLDYITILLAKARAQRNNVDRICLYTKWLCAEMRITDDRFIFPNPTPELKLPSIIDQHISNHCDTLLTQYARHSILRNKLCIIIAAIAAKNTALISGDLILHIMQFIIGPELANPPMTKLALLNTLSISTKERQTIKQFNPSAKMTAQYVHPLDSKPVQTHLIAFAKYLQTKQHTLQTSTHVTTHSNDLPQQQETTNEKMLSWY